MDFGCIIKTLPAEHQVAAAERAISINPLNRFSPKLILEWLERIRKIATIFNDEAVEKAVTAPERIAVMTGKYWGKGGTRLTVGFPFDSTPTDLQARILTHMNSWGAYCNVSFALTSGQAQVRIARNPDGYWSYLGTDVLSIPANQPTMNLEGFTMNTPESEFHRVVRHETGHTLGCPHEHMRQELVARLDVNKTIAYFQQTQGWSPQMTRQQVLTPISEASIMGTPHADQDSIMCYQLPGSITIDGQPIRGGIDIDPLDGSFMGTLYPLVVQPPPPPPPPGGCPIPIEKFTVKRPLAAGTKITKTITVPWPAGEYGVIHTDQQGAGEPVVDLD